MYQDNSRKNISNFLIWFIPIIIASKVVRWTIMFRKLVMMSIGNGMILRMNWYRFHATVLSQTTAGSSVTENNAGALFRTLNIFGIYSTSGWEIYISILCNLILLFIIIDYYKRTPTAGTKETIFIYLGVAILNIFCFCLAKEPYQFLFFVLMGYAIKKGKGYQMKSILLAGAIFITVLYSRKYYGLVLIYYFILQYLVRYLFDGIDFKTKSGKKKLTSSILIASVAIGFCYFFILSFLAVNNEDTYNEMMSANHRDMSRATVADSEIVPLFPKGNKLLATIDYVLKIFRLMFPIELLLKGKLTYLFLIAHQGLLVLAIRNAFINRRTVYNEEETEEQEDGEEISSITEQEDDDEEEVINEDEEEELDEDEKELIVEKIKDRKDIRTSALYLYLAFLLCSAAFEPDFGSWIRHQGVVLPVMLLIF